MMSAQLTKQSAWSVTVRDRGESVEVVKSELRKHARSLHTRGLVINNGGWTKLVVNLMAGHVSLGMPWDYAGYG